MNKRKWNRRGKKAKGVATDSRVIKNIPVLIETPPWGFKVTPRYCPKLSRCCCVINNDTGEQLICKYILQVVGEEVQCVYTTGG